MTLPPAFGAEVAVQGGTTVCLFDDVSTWRSYLRSLAGKRVRVTVVRETRGRTLPQNAWLFGVIYPLIADWSGHTPEEIHMAMKELHGVKRLLIMPHGQQMLATISTADYTTEEFSIYCERVRAWAAMQGLNIPDPGEVS